MRYVARNIHFVEEYMIPFIYSQFFSFGMSSFLVGQPCKIRMWWFVEQLNVNVYSFTQFFFREKKNRNRDKYVTNWDLSFILWFIHVQAKMVKMALYTATANDAAAPNSNHLSYHNNYVDATIATMTAPHLWWTKNVSFERHRLKFRYWHGVRDTDHIHCWFEWNMSVAFMLADSRRDMFHFGIWQNEDKR